MEEGGVTAHPQIAVLIIKLWDQRLILPKTAHDLPKNKP
jgi:hypothetical protein